MAGEVRDVVIGNRFRLRLALTHPVGPDRPMVSVDLYDSTGLVDGILLDLVEAGEAGQALIDLAAAGG